MRSPLGIAHCTLLPKLLFLSDLLYDLVIIPFRYRHFSEKTEVNAPLLGCGPAKLTRLPVLAPKGQTLGHFFFGRRSVVEQSVSLQHVVTERVRDPPRISIQSCKQFSHSSHSSVLLTKVNKSGSRLVLVYSTGFSSDPELSAARLTDLERAKPSPRH
jgi:hypothetical protein